MSKTITIRNEVFLELKKIKQKEESFSELFERLARERTPVDALAKIRGSVVFRNKGGMLKEIEEGRSEKSL